MEETKQKELEEIISGIWRQMEAGMNINEELIPSQDAKEDRLALARRIGRLYLAFSRVLVDRLGQEEAAKAILEAIRDYALHCADARKSGIVDLPARGIHRHTEIVSVNGKKRLRCYGCGISDEFSHQKEEMLGALYCYIDACSFMMTLPHIKLIHTQMAPLGDSCCEFDLALADSDEMALVEEKGRDYREIDPLIREKTGNLFVKPQAEKEVESEHEDA